MVKFRAELTQRLVSICNVHTRVVVPAAFRYRGLLLRSGLLCLQLLILGGERNRRLNPRKIGYTLVGLIL